MSPAETRLLKVKYAVTFEFNLKPPVTVRGEAEGTNVHTVARRAVFDAKEKAKGQFINWSSISVLLDRVKDETQVDDTKELENEADEKDLSDEEV